MDFLSGWELTKGVVRFDVREDEVRRPVDGAVAAAAPVRKADDPLDLWGVLPDKPDGFGDTIALTVPREVIVKGHPV